MLNISVVLYRTPCEQVDRIVDLCRQLEGLHRLYLVDNSPTLSERYSRLELPFLEYIFTGKNLGYGKAHNIALEKSLADGIALHMVVNADVEISVSAIRSLCNYMEHHSEVALLSPKVYYPNGELQYLCKLLPTPLDLFGRRFLPSSLTARRQRRFELRDSGYDKVMNIAYLSGCCMLLRVDAMREVGLFDSRYFMYPEDIDLTRRLHQKYQTLFYPFVSVVHNHERASYKSLRMTFLHAWNLALYFFKWGWFFDRERREVNQRIVSLYLPT